MFFINSVVFLMITNYENTFIGRGDMVAKLRVGLANGSSISETFTFASIVACFTASLYAPRFFLLNRNCKLDYVMLYIINIVFHVN